MGEGEENMSGGVCREVYRGEGLALQVLDRDHVRSCSHAEPYAIISITDPHFKHPVPMPSDFCRAVLRLTFSDVYEREAHLKATSRHIVAFTSEMAQQVATFVQEQYGQGTRLIVVHCEAGMSRSAGVATALSQFYNRDETFFLVHYRPNSWVRKLVLEAMAFSVG